MNGTHTQFFLVPLICSLGVIVLSWIEHLMQTRRDERYHRGLIYRCAECGRVYEDTRHVPLSSCPGCRSLNEPVKR